MVDRNQIKSHIIQLEKRNEKNNTHSSLMDNSITEISCWKISNSKILLSFFLYILSLGILIIFSKLFTRLSLFLNFTRCSIHEVEYFLVVTKKESVLINAQKSSFNSKISIDNISKEILINSKYVGPEILNAGENFIILEYKNAKYVYIDLIDRFVPISLELNKYSNNEIYKYFGQGLLSEEECQYLKNKFGPNNYLSDDANLFNVILDKILSINTFYQFVTIVFVFTVVKYEVYGIILLVLLIVILVLTTIQNYRNLLKVVKNDINTVVEVIRKYSNLDTSKSPEIFINSKDLVPGDIILLKQGERIPCDVLILEGHCTIYDGYLSGQNSVSVKLPLSKNDKKFIFEENIDSMIFQGSIISNCQTSSNQKYIRGLVINTSYNTFKGNLMQKILFQPTFDQPLISDYKIIFGFIVTLMILTVCFYIFMFIRNNLNNYYQLGSIISPEFINSFYFNYKDKSKIETFLRGINCSKNYTPYCWTLSDFFKSIITAFIFLVPCILNIGIIFSIIYFQYSLGKSELYCLSNSRMIASGKVNTIIFDKTGTLTEEGVTLIGFQTTKNPKKSEIHENSATLDEIEYSAKSFLKKHKEFWIEYSKNSDEFINENGDYREMSKYNGIYFLECLATCNSIYKINGETIGNSEDKSISEALGWIQDIEYEGKEKEPTYYFYPNYSFLITQNFCFNSTPDEQAKKKYRLKIIKKFHFSSKFQACSVVIQNELDNTYRFYIKGAPEKILDLCDPFSIPKGCGHEIINHTRKGRRVLACATRTIEDISEVNLEYKFEKKLKFLGIIIFKNELKQYTKKTIDNLKNADLNILIATGDNPFTSISVANKCRLFDHSKELYFLNLEKSVETRQYIKFYKILLKPEEVNIEDEGKSLLSFRSFSEYHRWNEEIEDSRKSYGYDLELTTTKSIFQNPNPENVSNSQLFKVIEYLESDDTIQFCLIGKTLNYIIENRNKEILNNQENEKNKPVLIFDRLANLIQKRGKVFARMKPADKSTLIEFLKEDPNKYIAYCGDGANDCTAFLSSDVGISISSAEQSYLTSHVYSTKKSIATVDKFFANCRACYENVIMITRFILIFGVVCNTMNIESYLNNSSQLANNQFIFIDIFTVLIPMILISKTSPKQSLRKNKNMTMRKWKFYFSFFGQIIIQIIFQIAFFQLFLNNSTAIKSKKYDSYNFIFGDIQILSCLLIFNIFSEHRMTMFKNKIYTLYISILVFVTLGFVSNYIGEGWFLNFKNGGGESAFTRIKIIGFAALNTSVTLIFEILINSFA